ncbi:hypothetical protein A3F08_03430 [Candidatus Berkelbacteria bacterium RIFCSPHIGHO2_12_FULL_36_9]|uniref:Haloacid dehalogenase-like hydrolase n=1 Tax=Candidatus Berkelbacteria bacterium RIFCSPHIGHO2_12_FULL_36_9 TaxID=1797469 RepID=A0A1F5EHG8_9BACT|nr:MAG: hypothetical protein A3F08_03430 [Candidatus Berkelbacteria bacterium RIFCSPHIGHO2_12_FULL_36_9]
MKTIIFDIDGTITNMWPIEKSVLLGMLRKNTIKEIDEIYQQQTKKTYQIYNKISKEKLTQKEFYRRYNRTFLKLLINNQLPKPAKYTIVNWIISNHNLYHFVYVTGGQRLETKYVLDMLKVSKYFDFTNSLDKSNCRFAKKTGIPYKIIKRRFNNCLVITDSKNDCLGAIKTEITFIKV